MTCCFSMKGQIYDLNELLGEEVKKKSGNNDYQDFLKNIVIFSRWYSYKTKINDVFGDYTA